MQAPDGLVSSCHALFDASNADCQHGRPVPLTDFTVFVPKTQEWHPISMEAAIILHLNVCL